MPLKLNVLLYSLCVETLGISPVLHKAAVYTLILWPELKQHGSVFTSCKLDQRSNPARDFRL